MGAFLTALPAILQAGGGLLQTIFSGRRKREREFEQFVDTIKPNASITDYYNKALQRFDANAYNSGAYRQGQQNIAANMTTGISQAQNRRGGLAAISNLNAQSNRAALQNVAQAENIQNANLSRLGSAASAEAQNQNRITDMRYNLKALRAGQAAQRQNMGLSNLFGGLSNASMMLDGDGNSISGARNLTSSGLMPMGSGLSSIKKKTIG
jgi:hypothetical protein